MPNDKVFATFVCPSLAGGGVVLKDKDWVRVGWSCHKVVKQGRTGQVGEEGVSVLKAVNVENLATTAIFN